VIVVCDGTGSFCSVDNGGGCGRRFNIYNQTKQKSRKEIFFERIINSIDCSLFTAKDSGVGVL
jgi:hypothetical protein